MSKDKKTVVSKSDKESATMRRYGSLFDEMEQCLSVIVPCGPLIFTR